MNILRIPGTGDTLPGDPIPAPPEISPHRAGVRAQAALVIGRREVGDGSTWGRHHDVSLDELDAVYWQAYRATARALGIPCNG